MRFATLGPRLPTMAERLKWYLNGMQPLTFEHVPWNSLFPMRRDDCAPLRDERQSELYKKIAARARPVTTLLQNASRVRASDGRLADDNMGRRCLSVQTLITGHVCVTGLCEV